MFVDIIGNLIGELLVITAFVADQGKLWQQPGQDQLDQRCIDGALLLQCPFGNDLFNGIGDIGVDPVRGEKRILRMIGQQGVGVSAGVGQIADDQGRIGVRGMGGVTVDLVGKDHRQITGRKNPGPVADGDGDFSGKAQIQFRLGMKVQGKTQTQRQAGMKMIGPFFKKGMHGQSPVKSQFLREKNHLVVCIVAKGMI